MKIMDAVCLLTIGLTLLPETIQSGPNCKDLVLVGDSFGTDEIDVKKSEKFTRPPMVAYEVHEEGDVRNVRLVQRSGNEAMDQRLLSTASHWRYQKRVGCGTVKVAVAAGRISDRQTALVVGDRALVREYGERLVASERPLTAELAGEVWTVGGTVHCDRDKNGATATCVGGSAAVHLSKSDGRVIQVFQTL